MRYQDATGIELNLFDELIAASHNIVVENFRQEVSPQSVVRMADIVMRETEGLQSGLARKHQLEFACRKGCHWCCFARVSASTLEVLALAEYIRAHFSPEEQAAIRERVAESAAQRADFDWEAQKVPPQPCPLLLDRACSVYEARPLVCRGWTSRDAEACRLSIEDPDGDPPPIPFFKIFREITVSVFMGVRSGLNQTPLQNDNLELIAALHVALEKSDILEHWLSGEQVFPEACFIPGTTE